MKEQIVTNVNTAPEKENDKEILNEIFLAKYTQGQNRKNSLLQFGLQNPKQLLANCTPTSREEAITKFAVQLLRDARQEKMPLAGMKKKTDDALKILFAFYKEKRGNVSPETLILIAEAYYLASVAILPKGITIPEKKKEALSKGIEFINRAIRAIDLLKNSSPATVSTEEASSQARSNSSTGAEHLTPSPPAKTNSSSRAEINSSSRAESREEAFRIKSLLSIEKNRIDRHNCDDDTLKNILKEAVANGCCKYNEKKEDVLIAVRLCELGENVAVETHCHASPIKLNDIKANYLQRTKLYYFLNKDNDNTLKYMNKCINLLKYRYLSHRLWDETVGFIERLMLDKSSLWKNFALGAYEACRKQESKTGILRLRWYWSRRGDLYDMAFLAAKKNGDKMRMAEISDSLKSRTSLRLSALQKIKGEDNRIKEFYDNIEKNYTNSYVKGSTDEAELSEEIGKKPPEKIDYTNVPKGWVVIHFYLNQLEGMGYAILYDKEADTWQYKDFPYKELFNAFITWQTNYSLYKEGAARYLVELCRTIGSAMPFLFENDFIPPEKDVLFIPHDFLHRLPLHGAIKEETNEVFLQKCACCYLPAWSFAEGSRAEQENADQSCAGQSLDEQSNAEHIPSAQYKLRRSMEESAVHKHVLLKNFEEHDQRYFKDVVTMDWDLKRIAASHEDLKKVNSPELLTILCHGEADMVNPFRSKLKLVNGGITHLEILKYVNGVKDTQIILGACETDLVPPLSDVMDEHTSVATAFLIKKARGILGTMWEVDPIVVEGMIEEFLNKEKIPFLRNFIHTWQKEKFKIWAKKTGNTTIFYDTIPFRTFADITTKVD
ncbi:MAG: CHAT domain-containing protein [Candidatus Kuenenia sp.]|nr:CHAT domain-containing protein [Candidatus Kuenenia hertensis]